LQIITVWKEVWLLLLQLKGEGMGEQEQEEADKFSLSSWLTCWRLIFCFFCWNTKHPHILVVFGIEMQIFMCTIES
jgi:hypothetical protein